jgi:hypothetical protein
MRERYAKLIVSPKTGISTMPHPFLSVIASISAGLFGRFARRMSKVIGVTGHRQWQPPAVITYGLWKNGSVTLFYRVVS